MVQRICSLYISLFHRENNQIDMHKARSFFYFRLLRSFARMNKTKFWLDVVPCPPPVYSSETFQTYALNNSLTIEEVSHISSRCFPQPPNTDIEHEIAKATLALPIGLVTVLLLVMVVIVLVQLRRLRR